MESEEIYYEKPIVTLERLERLEGVLTVEIKQLMDEINRL